MGLASLEATVKIRQLDICKVIEILSFRPNTNRLNALCYEEVHLPMPKNGVTETLMHQMSIKIIDHWDIWRKMAIHITTVQL